ncbi:hypothetical protein EV421DRAFT_108655 [Armillaria borealis]|uniref:Uncharacterized protein n=1 Tax=Armillaria borealis TaxID=47425 RepID=A0AA39JUD6_9AGAR|nr:hypothetical protein EV421DRAFT_108655 [Armillaria borealis]
MRYHRRGTILVFGCCSLRNSLPEPLLAVAHLFDVLRLMPSEIITMRRAYLVSHCFTNFYLVPWKYLPLAEVFVRENLGGKVRKVLECNLLSRTLGLDTWQSWTDTLQDPPKIDGQAIWTKSRRQMGLCLGFVRTKAIKLVSSQKIAGSINFLLSCLNILGFVDKAPPRPFIQSRC